MKKAITISILVLAVVALFFFGVGHLRNRSNGCSTSTAACEPDIEALISNVDAVLNDYAPVEFVRPLTTEEARFVFSFLYHRQYFRARFRESNNDIYYHIDLPWFGATKVYEEYYNGPKGPSNVSTLRRMLERVDRRRFYKHVVNEIAGDKSVYAIQRWVAQNMSRSNFITKYENENKNNIVVDGAELIFNGYGQCGQTNRLLASLLKFGAEQNVRVVATPGHVYVEWEPDGGSKRILDADFLKDKYLPSVSTEDLISDFETSRKIIDSSVRGNFSGLSTSTAYIQKEKGEAWIGYYDISLSKDGTKYREKSLSKVFYQSPGHKTILFKSVKLMQEDSTKVEIEYELENIERPIRLYVWMTNNPSGYSLQELPYYDWLWDVVAEASCQINPENNRVVVDTKKTLPDGDYTTVLAVSNSGFDVWGFYNVSQKLIKGQL